MRPLPEPLEAVAAQLAKLPGLGPKSALRVAMKLLRWPEAETRRLAAGINRLRDELSLCSRCGGLTATDPCPICSDETRARDLLCLTQDWDAMLALESGGFYRGQYLILGGPLAPGQQDGGLDMDRLRARLDENEVTEVILALGSTIEAENTAAFAREILAKSHPGLKVTRLAQGMPLGAEVKHMDSETLRQSMNNRQSL